MQNNTIKYLLIHTHAIKVKKTLMKMVNTNFRMVVASGEKNK